jgi:hypothetical protein
MAECDSGETGERPAGIADETGAGPRGALHDELLSRLRRLLSSDNERIALDAAKLIVKVLEQGPVEPVRIVEVIRPPDQSSDGRQASGRDFERADAPSGGVVTKVLQ